tara:strand:- start:2157 stop:4091 length:1935 start_codon:yes stop_codon:yes gene_type:complete
MCGIFGFSKKIDVDKNFENIFSDIKKIVNLSSSRGSDTFGISFYNNKENFIYKLNQKPKKAVKNPEFKKFISNNLKKNKNNELMLIGQNRLVTNGSKFSYLNNQPLITENIVGIHNGIFTNLDHSPSDKTINYESFNVKSDSLIFFEELSKIANSENFIEKYIKYINSMIGNFSIAFFLNNEKKIFISSNCGSLYYYYDNEFFAFASEKKILEFYLKDSKIHDYKNKNIKKCLNNTIIYDLNSKNINIIDHSSDDINKFNNLTNNNFKLKIHHNLDEEKSRLKNLKKCSKCILPETYPFIKFDEKNICNFCNEYEKQKFKGEEELNKIFSKHRSNNEKVDCIVGLSGGRDSCYGLHLIKKKYKMNPIAYTYDWGLTTDVSRINASKVCGKLGIEHIIRSADIEKKRKFVNMNLFAWLNRPHLGMLPIIQAGDKGFYEYGRKISKEINVKLMIQCTGYQLEQREFFLGFAGIDQKIKNNQSLYSYNLFNKFRMLYWYSLQFLLNPKYINAALFDNFKGFIYSFVRKDSFLHLYNYETWNENTIIKVLNEEYNWKDDISYGKNQWRMGDGQTAFNNFVYYTIAGFSEYDNFRSNQIREGLISREEALKLCKEDNRTRYDTLKNFSDVIGFNLDDVLSKISCLPKLY